ncbi:MAG: aspartate ammonia-lyase [Treponema sp. CETP13]|nr:MAG: aspartate ammonia-lyase [Treponema sp. CETP13]
MINKDEKRIESDSIGSMEVPTTAYYGVQSLRAQQNFPITGIALHPAFIQNLAFVKKAAAYANNTAHVISEKKLKAIIQACDEIIEGKFQSEFIVDAIQGGAGTSANMNINEVIANRANELLGGKRGGYEFIHPNDDVNTSQSTNDVIPTAGKLATLELLQPLEDELLRLQKALSKKACEFKDVIKMGRTQLQDAVPMTLGQSFAAYSSMIKRSIKIIRTAKKEMNTVNLGATAIGSAINVSDIYLQNVVPILSEITGYKLEQAEDLFDGTQNIDGFTVVSSALKTCAINLSKMCNDLRLLSSGPRAGINEICLPAKQNGSSIMPGKVNPVIPEVVSQVAFSVIGNDTTISMAAEAGQMELNAFEPIVFFKLFESITTLTSAITTLIDNCITGILANKEECKNYVEQSVGIATALCPFIGYKKSAEIAKHALKIHVPVRDLVLEQHLMKEVDIDSILNPRILAKEDNNQLKLKRA